MLMINVLASLLIITSLCVIMAKTAKKSALCYGLQSLVLVVLFVYLAFEMQAHELYMWCRNECRLVDPDHIYHRLLMLLCCHSSELTVS